MLLACGITKERITSLSGAKDCGCKKRQEAMNRYGFLLQHWIFYPVLLAQQGWHGVRMNPFWGRLRLFFLHIRIAVRIVLLGRP